MKKSRCVLWAGKYGNNPEDLNFHKSVLQSLKWDNCCSSSLHYARHSMNETSTYSQD